MGARRYPGGVTREGTDEWPVRIESTRLLIREGRDADRTSLIRLLTDPVTREYLGGAVDYASRQALELSPLGLTWGNWVIAQLTDDTMIGSISLDYDRGELQLSYALLPEYVGYGFAGEACRAVLAWAQDNLEDTTVIAVSQARNKRAIALLKRLGFTTRRGLEEFGTQQLLMERTIADPLPEGPEAAWSAPRPIRPS